MNNNIKEVSDKVAGTVKVAAGKATNNPGLELKGQYQRGKGVARGVARNVTDEMEDMKDNVVGSVKEVTGRLTNNEILQLRGKLQKSKANDDMMNKVILGLGVIAGLYLIKTLMSNNED